MNLDSIIFAVSAAVTIFGALMMISSRNPIASVLYMILSLVAQAVLYVQLAAVFLGAVLIIVYAGAILVLFLFVIMLLNLRGSDDFGPRPPIMSSFSKYLVAILMLVEFVFILREAVFTGNVTTGIMEMSPETFGAAEDVSWLLYTKYMYPFELTAVLLLVAIVGAVVIARKERADDTEGREA